MRVKAKKYNMRSGKKPNVLLIGNGLSRAFGNISWNSFLDQVKNKKRFTKKASEYDLPMPLKAVLLTEDDLFNKLRDNKDLFFGDDFHVSQQERDLILNLMEIDFDFVLTTNYSYELELSLLGKDSISERELQSRMVHTNPGNAENIYLLHTFNRIPYHKEAKIAVESETGDSTVRDANAITADRSKYGTDINDPQSDTRDIWHIHGEVRKPRSMIVGHYWYSKLLFNYQDIIDKRKYEVEKDNIILESWLDAFLIGNVYVVGFGFDYSEIDLWYLLNRKKAARPREHGKVVFYEPVKENEKTSNKHALLDVMDVEIRTLGYDIPAGSKGQNEQYINFYRDVAGDIKKDTGNIKTKHR